MNWEQYHLLMDSEAITDPTDFRIMVAMVHFASPKEAEVCAAKEKIAKKARLAVLPVPRATIDGLKRLVKQGHLTLLSKGGGKSKTDRYRVNIQAQNLPDTLHDVQGIEEVNTAPDAGYEEIYEADTLHLTTENESYTLHPTTKENPIPCIPRHAYKDEVFNKDIKSFNIEESSRAQNEALNFEVEINEPIELKNFDDSPNDKRFKHPLFFAICKACELDPDFITHRKKCQVVIVAAAFQKKGITVANIETAIKNWPHSTAPEVEQLQNRIQALLRQKEKPSAAPLSDFAKQREAWKKNRLVVR